MATPKSSVSKPLKSHVGRPHAHAPKPGTPQLDQGLYILFDANNAECGQVVVVGSATTGTEYWFLYAAVPSGYPGVPYIPPSKTNKNATIKFSYTGLPVDPYWYKQYLVGQGFVLVCVQSQSSPF